MYSENEAAAFISQAVKDDNSLIDRLMIGKNIIENKQFRWSIIY